MSRSSSQLAGLALVVTTGMRNASLDIAHLHRRGVVVCGTERISAAHAGGVPSTVEVAWALIFALLKRVLIEDRALRAGHWQTDLPANLGGATLGLAGLGHLGAAMVEPARAFGMDVIAWSQNLTAERAELVGAQPVSKEALLARADVLSIHLVLSDRTRGLFGAAELAQMRPTAVLINTSRGPIVDEQALVGALRDGTIAGAGLDVYETEPLPAGHVLTTLDNAVLLPHLGYVVGGVDARHVPAGGAGHRRLARRRPDPPDRLTSAASEGASMDRMSAQDASFLHLETDASPMHVGGVSIFDGPPPPDGRFEDHVAARLDLVPRYRQVVRTVPLGLGSPVWVDDPYFNLGYHVRRTALPSPGSDQQLRALVGRVMSQNLDPDKPLWEMWMVEGLGDGRWALVSKVHHCMVDGIASTDLMTVLLDATPEPAQPDQASAWASGPYPTEAQLLAEALAGGVRLPLRIAGTALATVRDPRRLLAAHRRGRPRARRVVEPGAATAAVLAQRPARAAPPLGIGPRHARRRTGRSAAGSAGPSTTSCWRRSLRASGICWSPAASASTDRLRSLVPVSVRAPDERGTYNNRVSAMFAELPIEIDDPVERLLSVAEQMADLKESSQAVAGEVLTSLSGFAPPLLLMLGARVAGRLPQRSVNTGTTNVPGPQFPLYASGRRMLEAFPYIPLFANVRLAVAIFSYDGRLSFGISGDYDTTADLQLLCDGIERGLADLVSAARRG